METLAGLGAFGSLLVEILKKLKVIPDGYGGLAAITVDVLIFIAMTYAGYFKYDLGQIDQVAAMLAEILAVVLASWLTHKGARAMQLPLFRK